MKKILILAGGYSKENALYVGSTAELQKLLKKDRKYKIKVVNPDGKFVNILRKFKPNTVLNLLHGRYGEDGYIQAILESEKIKYTHSGVLSSSLAIDKELSKKIFIKNNILTPKYLKFSYRNNINKSKLINNLQKKIGFPLVVKPLNEGSSVNVFICNKNNILKTLTKLNEYGEVLLEKYIPGREIQVAILENKVLGAIELRPTRKFNPKARTEHIIPVEISKRKYQELTKIALKAHKILNCRGVTRSDFRYYKNSFYLLETNTQPGMTSLSLVPEIANFNNITFKNLIIKILEDASINK